MLVLAEEGLGAPSLLSGLIAELTSCIAFSRLIDSSIACAYFGSVSAPGLRFEGERVAAVGLFGQVVFQQFGRGGRAGAGQGQVVVGLVAGGLAGDTSTTATITQTAIVGQWWREQKRPIA